MDRVAKTSAYSPLREVRIALTALAVSTIVAAMLRSHVAATNLAMVYLIGVIVVAMYCRRRTAILVSLVGVATFDFFCVPPYLTLRVSDYQYLITFAAMLIAAVVISSQTGRIRNQAAEAMAREARNETLAQLSRRLSGHSRIFDVARAAAEFAQEIFERQVVIFLPEDGKITFRRRSSERLPVPTDEEPIAQWAFENDERAGHGTARMAGASALYLPLQGTKETLGVMAMVTGSENSVSPSQMHLLELVANQTATAIERSLSQQAAETARVEMHAEQMRSSLLSAVSHDLRTPLASITGATSALRSQSEKLTSETRQELLDSIADEAERLSRLVSNLLDMTRLESGVELRRDYYPLEEIVGSALQRMEKQLESRQVTTSLPDSLPLVFADDVLLGQLIVNLIENAIKYTPKGTPIEIAAEARAGEVILQIRDFGPGFARDEEMRVFEKFYRGKSDVARGAGLGLAICRAIIQAHGGTIEAFNATGGGALFRIHLPVIAGRTSETP